MKDATEILFVLDKSGSMFSLTSDVHGGFDSFLKEQKAIEGEIFLTLVSFNHEVQFHKRRDLRAIENLDSIMCYTTSGTTALYDAVGDGISELGKALAGIPESKRPDKVIVVIMTDGYENASRRFNSDLIASMIEHQRTKYNWQFLFMGANIDTVAEGAKINIPKASTYSYAASGQGVRGAYACASAAVAQMRNTNSTSDPDKFQAIEWANKLKTEQGNLPSAKK